MKSFCLAAASCCRARSLCIFAIYLTACLVNTFGGEPHLTAGQPNLVPRSVVLSSYAVLPGDVVSVDWTTANTGSGYAFATFTGIRLGTSPSVPPPGSTFDLTFTTPDIPPQSAVHQSVSFTIPRAAPFGTYYIWVISDLYGGANQTTRADDAAASSALRVQNVAGQPNLIPLNVTLSGPAGRPGDPVTVVWTLTNAGPVSCAASFTGVHIGNSPVSPTSGEILKFSLPTPSLPANSALRFTNVVTIPAGTSPGTYYVWIVADDVANSSLNQSSRADDAARASALSVISPNAQPNLIPSNITLSRSLVMPGNQLVAAWTLTNSGAGPCPASLTGLHLGAAPTAPPASDPLDLKFPTAEIAAGGSLRVTNIIAIPGNLALGTYYLWVIADDVPNSSLNQTSRSDDAARSGALTVAAFVERPNLVPRDIQLGNYSLAPGNLLSVMWTTTNSGNGDCGASFTGLRLGTSPTEPPAFDPINIVVPTPEIPGHSSTRQTNLVTIPAGLPVGNYFLWVICDDVAVSTIDQTSRNDDAARSAVFSVLVPPAQPNLVPQNVALSAGYVRPGDAFTVRWTIRNLGTVTCPSSYTGIRFGPSASVPPTNGVIQLLLEMPEIAAGGTLNQTNTVTVPTHAPLGTNYLWIVADDVSNSSLNQSSRADDAVRSGALQVVSELPKPNLAPLNVTLSTNTVLPGGQMAVIWTMTNSGNATCPASATGLHLGTSATVPPSNDSLDLEIATPAIEAKTSILQTNLISIPGGTPAGTYYLWVIADDVTNSPLNQVSKADDVARSAPFSIVTQLPRPNLRTSDVQLSRSVVPPGGQVAIDWAIENSGTADCPPSTTGLHLGVSPAAPPAGDPLNLKLVTPAIAAGATLRQTNLVTVPATLVPGTYYLWVIADDVTNSELNQVTRTDDVVRSSSLAISTIALVLPAAGETVSAPPEFKWSAPGIETSLYLANKSLPVIGVDPIVSYEALPADTAGVVTLTLALTNWAAAIHALGYAPAYYWTVGSPDGGEPRVFSDWRSFKSVPSLAALTNLASPGVNFGFEILAPNAPQVFVEASEAVTNFVTIGTFQNTTGAVKFIDNAPLPRATRFYRARQ